MNILFDASPLLNQKTGIGYYTYSLVTAMLKLNPENSYYLFDKYSCNILPNNIALENNTKMPLHGNLSRLRSKLFYYLWYYAGLSVFDLKLGLKADISHGVNFYPIPTKNGKSVVTIHDLYFLINPQHLGTIAKATLPWEIYKSAQKADFIITVSESASRDVLDKLSINPDKVRAIPVAAREQFRCINNEEINSETREKYVNGQPYILFVGTLEPRKNLVRLVKAYGSIKKRGYPHKLIMAGRRGWLYEEIFQTINQLGLEKDVITPDYIPEEDLVALYNAADLFAFPSLYEGFGVPVLEAMACGAPVITSNTSSLPEVAGEAALLVHPEDVDGLTNSIEKILTDKELRSSLRQKGFEQAQKFSWIKTAQQTMEVYRNLMNS